MDQPAIVTALVPRMLEAETWVAAALVEQRGKGRRNQRPLLVGVRQIGHYSD